MRAFADLLDRLIYTRSRNAKLRLIVDYLRATPDPDRGWAMAALTGELDLAGGETGCDPRVDRGAGGPSAVQDEPRLCRRYRRDGCPVVADPARHRDRSATRHGGGGRTAGTTVPVGYAGGPRADARPARFGRTLRAAQDGDWRIADRCFVTARQDGAGSGIRLGRRGGGRGLARDRTALHRAVRLGRRPWCAADCRRRSRVSSLHARASA